MTELQLNTTWKICAAKQAALFISWAQEAKHDLQSTAGFLERGFQHTQGAHLQRTCFPIPELWLVTEYINFRQSTGRQTDV